MNSISAGPSPASRQYRLSLSETGVWTTMSHRDRLISIAMKMTALLSAPAAGAMFRMLIRRLSMVLDLETGTGTAPVATACIASEEAA